MKYTLRYVHKISQRCKCGRPQGSHSRPVRDDERAQYPYEGQRVWGDGPCEYGGPPCPWFEHESEQVDIPELPQVATVAAKILRGAKLLGSGQRLYSVRHHPDGTVVCHPMMGIWHSLIFIPEIVRTVTGEP